MDIAASARKHGVDDEDILHAYRHHWRAFATDDSEITMFIGPRRDGSVDDRLAVPEGMVEAMSKVDRAKKLEAFERWGDTVDAGDLVAVDTTALKALMELSEQRTAVEAQLVEAVRQARANHHSWSEIGLMLGVSKQAAQRKYGRAASAA